MSAGLDDERVADARRDHATAARGVVVRHELDEAVDVLVRAEVVTRDRELDPEHLGRAGGLVGVHLAGEERPRTWDEVSELAWERAPEEADRRPVQLPDEPHVEDAGVAVVVDADAGLGLDDERHRVADDGRAVGERRHRPVVAFDRTHDEARDLHHDAPCRRRDLVGRDAVVDELGAHGGVADDGRACTPGDGGRIAVVVDRGVTDEDDIGRAQVVRPARRHRILGEEGIDQDGVGRRDDLVARRTVVRQPRAHARVAAPVRVIAVRAGPPTP